MRGGKKIGVCAFACILTPSPFGHSPYIPCRNTGGEVEMYSSFAFAPILYRIPRHAAGYGRGRGGLPLSLPLPVLFNPPVTTCHLLYILLGKTPRNATGHGKGGGEYPTKLRRDKTVQSDTFNPLPLLIADEIGGVPAGRGGKEIPAEETETDTNLWGPRKKYKERVQSIAIPRKNALCRVGWKLFELLFLLSLYLCYLCSRKLLGSVRAQYVKHERFFFHTPAICAPL